MVPWASQRASQDRVGLLFEYLHEQVADDLALPFRDRLRRPARQESLLGVHPNHLDARVLGKSCHYLVPFTKAQQAIVDEDAGELVADGPMDEGRRHRRIHSAGQAAE